MDNAVTIKNLTKKFKETVVLDDISVEFERGKIHGLIGRNGSGKTMLMKCVCGLVKPTAGEITVGGMRIGKDADIPRDIGVIIETPGFIPSYSAYNNLKFLAVLGHKIGKPEIRAAIRQVGLNPDDRKKVGKFSLGMRQRLGLAQALMEDPALLILDEPMNGLDKSGAAEMRELLKELRERGKTLIIASHYAEDIGEMCDTVHEMDKGRLETVR